MRKLMLLFLKTTYPNAYVYKCKFGSLIYTMDETNRFRLKDNTNLHINKLPNVDKLMHWFCCDKNIAGMIYDNWFDSLPVYVMGKNSTYEDVLVPLETECNSTFI